MSAHSTLGPSGAHRYRRCPGSVAAEAGLPDNAGMDAAIGTVFHEFASIALEFGADPYAMVGSRMEVGKFGSIEFTTEMANHMMAGLELIDSLHTPGVTQLYVEKRVDLSHWLGPNQFGTMDVGIVDPVNRRVIDFDWKYGAGVPVSPIENDQAALYTLGLWRQFAEPVLGDPEGVEVVILIEQPRAPGGGGQWVTDMPHLLRVGNDIRRDAKKTKDPNAPRIPGPTQCKFCKAKTARTCREHIEFNLDMIGQKFDDLEVEFVVGEQMALPPVEAMTPEMRSQVLLHKAMIESWLDDLHASAYRDAEAGRSVPGMKLTSGRAPPRDWKDPDIARHVVKKRLGNRGFVSKMLSPTQVQDTVGKKEYERVFRPFVKVGEAKPVLVPESDRRPAKKTHGDKYDEI